MELTALPLRRTRPYIPSGGHMTNYLSESAQSDQIRSQARSQDFFSGGHSNFFHGDIPFIFWVHVSPIIM